MEQRAGRFLSVFISLISLFHFWMGSVLVNIFVNLMQAGIIWDERTSIQKMLPSDWPVGKLVEHLLDS